MSYVLIDGQRTDVDGFEGATHVVASQVRGGRHWNLLSFNGGVIDPYEYAAFVRKTNPGMKARVLKIQN